MTYKEDEVVRWWCKLEIIEEKERAEDATRLVLETSKHLRPTVHHKESEPLCSAASSAPPVFAAASSARKAEEGEHTNTHHSQTA